MMKDYKLFFLCNHAKTSKIFLSLGDKQLQKLIEYFAQSMAALSYLLTLFSSFILSGLEMNLVCSAPIPTQQIRPFNRDLTEREVIAHHNVTIIAVMYQEDLEIEDIPGQMEGMLENQVGFENLLY